MKEGLAVILFFMLIALGWKQSYKTHVNNLFGVTEAEQQRATTVLTGATPSVALPNPYVAPAPTPDRSWLFSPKAMDKPYNPTRNR